MPSFFPFGARGKKPGSRGGAPGGVWGEAPRPAVRPELAGCRRRSGCAFATLCVTVPRIHSASCWRHGPSMSHPSGGSIRGTALSPEELIRLRPTGLQPATLGATLRSAHVVSAGDGGDTKRNGSFRLSITNAPSSRRRATATIAVALPRRAATRLNSAS